MLACAIPLESSVFSHEDEEVARRARETFPRLAASKPESSGRAKRANLVELIALTLELPGRGTIIMLASDRRVSAPAHSSRHDQNRPGAFCLRKRNW